MSTQGTLKKFRNYYTSDVYYSNDGGFHYTCNTGSIYPGMSWSGYMQTDCCYDGINPGIPLTFYVVPSYASTYVEILSVTNSVICGDIGDGVLRTYFWGHAEEVSTAGC